MPMHELQLRAYVLTRAGRRAGFRPAWCTRSHLADRREHHRGDGRVFADDGEQQRGACADNNSSTLEQHLGAAARAPAVRTPAQSTRTSEISGREIARPTPGESVPPRWHATSMAIAPTHDWVNMRVSTWTPRASTCEQSVATWTERDDRVRARPRGAPAAGSFRGARHR